MDILSLNKYHDELSMPEVIIYGCAECGDYDCGGIRITIDRPDESVAWKILDENKSLVFEFNKYQYFDTFNGHLKYLQQRK
jgi:hypothetical protein